MEIEKGDTGGILEYLHKRQLEDSNFVYAIQVDEDDMMTNIFWADEKMRNDYSNYGDVVCFGTTYRKNGEGRPLAIFVGVNNHKQTAVFSVALLYDETTESFEWLFDTFSKVMFEEKSQTILTDEDAAMAKGQHFGSANMFMEQPYASQNVAAQMCTQPTIFHSNLGEQRPLTFGRFMEPTIFHSNLGEQRPLAFGRFMEQTQPSMIHSNHGAQSPLAFGRGVQQSLPQVLGVSSSLGFSSFRTQSPIGFGTPYGCWNTLLICNEQCGCSLSCVGMSCVCYREK